MSRKNTLNPIQMLNAVSLAADIAATPLRIQYLDNVSMQLIVTTSNAVGTFYVQGSLDYAVNEGGIVTNTGTWTSLTLSPVPTLASANTTILLDLNQLSFPFVRLIYTRVSGTGTVTAYGSAKSV